MKSPVFLLIILASAVCLAQTPQATPPQTEPNRILPGTVIPAELSKSLDAKKAKPGDKVEAKTTMDMLSHGKIVIPRNSKIEGHVTSAKPHTKESPQSELGIAFDRIRMKDTGELPMQAAIQAIAPPIRMDNTAAAAAAGMGAPVPSQSSPTSGPGNTGPGGMGSANSQGAAPGSVGQAPPMGSRETGSAGPSGVLAPEAKGAVDMKDATLTSAKEANVIASNSKNVKLDGGTQMMLRVE
jgi:hypothetical protein